MNEKGEVWLSSVQIEILRSTDWLRAEDWGDTWPAMKTGDPRQWEAEGRIFSVRVNDTSLYPAYMFDSETHLPVAGLAEVIRAFRKGEDGWHLAIWFASTNSYLGGRRPQDRLLEDAAAVVGAAQIEGYPVEHG